MQALLVGPLLILAMAGLIVIFPVLAPLIAALQARDRWRLRKAADGASCTRCGRLLGQAALDAADIVWADELAAMRRQHPHATFRIVRHLHARCTACGAEYDWDGQRFTRLCRDGGGIESCS